MKPLSSIRLLLGVSQTEMARLLQVNRSQLAMFETGKRDLPRAAKLLLAPMLAQATQAGLTARPETGYPDTKKREYLQGLLQENELQRIKMARKLESIGNQYQRHRATLNLTAFLSGSATHRHAHCLPLVHSLEAKARNALADCNPLVLMKCEIQLELLELEQLLLKEYCDRYSPEGPKP